jgi:protein SCO1/2
MPRRSILLFAAACFVIAAALAIITVVVVTGREQAAAVSEGTATGQASVGGPFQMVDQDGKTVDQTLQIGRAHV